MKKASLAATIALALLGATAAANANGTVKSQPAAATPAPATTAASAAPTMASAGGALNPASAEVILRPGNHKLTNFELDLMFPIFQPSCGDRLLALDIRGMRDVNRNTEGNFGAVYRQIINNNFVLGGYVYGDYRRTRNKNNFGQLTVGADILSNMIDARFNGYITQNKKKSVAGTSGVQFTGNSISRTGQFEIAQSGFDGEIGFRIPMPGMNNIETRIFAGGYRFSRSGTKTMAGPRGRLEVRILDIVNPGSRLTLGVDVSNDKVRKTSVNGVIGLRIPLQFISGGKVPQGLQRRLADYVYRDVNVNTALQTNVTGTVKGPNGPYKAVFLQGPGSGTAAAAQGGNGKFESPYLTGDNKLATDLGSGGDVVLVTLGDGNVNISSVITPAAGTLNVLGSAVASVLTDYTDGTPLTILPASSKYVTLVSSGGALYTFNPGAASEIEITGVGHQPQAGAASGLINSAAPLTKSLDLGITGLQTKLTGASPTTRYVDLRFDGAQNEGSVSVSNSTFSGFDGPTIIRLGGSGGAKVSYAGSSNTISGPTGGGAATGITLSTDAAPGTFTDVGSSYSGLGSAIFIVDDTAVGAAAVNPVKVSIDKAKISNNASGIAISRSNGAGPAAKVAFTASVTNTTFTSTAGTDLILGDDGAGAAATSVAGVNSNLDVTLQGNTHNNSGGASAMNLVMTDGGVAADASSVKITAKDITMTDSGGALSAVIITGNNAGNATNSITFTGTNVKATGYASGVTLAGAQLLAAAAGGTSYRVLFTFDNQSVFGAAGGVSYDGTAGNFSLNANTVGFVYNNGAVLGSAAVYQNAMGALQPAGAALAPLFPGQGRR